MMMMMFRYDDVSRYSLVPTLVGWLVGGLLAWSLLVGAFVFAPFFHYFLHVKSLK